MKAHKLKPLTRAQTTYLKVLVRHNALSDTEYRDLLHEAAGVRSSTELDSAGLDRVLELMAALGYDLGQWRRRPALRYGDRPGMATPEQLAYLDQLRFQVFGEHEPPFCHWLERFFKVSHPRFLTRRTASTVIEGLKAMSARSSTAEGGRS